MLYSQLGWNYYSKKEVMAFYKALSDKKKVKILEKCIDKMGSKEYLIAGRMGFVYQDDGSYGIPADKDTYAPLPGE